MLSTNQAVRPRRDWETTIVKWTSIFAAIIFVLVAVIEARDPEGTKHRAAETCIRDLATGPSATFPCTGKIFDLGLKIFLDHPDREHLEVASMAATSEASAFGSSGTKGFTVVFRAKQK